MQTHAGKMQHTPPNRPIVTAGPLGLIAERVGTVLTATQIFVTPLDIKIDLVSDPGAFDSVDGADTGQESDHDNGKERQTVQQQHGVLRKSRRVKRGV